MIQAASERRWRLLPWRLLVHDNLPIITHTHTKEATRTSSMLEQAISKERKRRVFVRFNNVIRQCVELCRFHIVQKEEDEIHSHIHNFCLYNKTEEWFGGNKKLETFFCVCLFLLLLFEFLFFFNIMWVQFSG